MISNSNWWAQDVPEPCFGPWGGGSQRVTHHCSPASLSAYRVVGGLILEQNHFEFGLRVCVSFNLQLSEVITNSMWLLNHNCDRPCPGERRETTAAELLFFSILAAWMIYSSKSQQKKTKRKSGQTFPLKEHFFLTITFFRHHLVH